MWAVSSLSSDTSRTPHEVRDVRHVMSFNFLFLGVARTCMSCCLCSNRIFGTNAFIRHVTIILPSPCFKPPVLLLLPTGYYKTLIRTQTHTHHPFWWIGVHSPVTLCWIHDPSSSRMTFMPSSAHHAHSTQRFVNVCLLHCDEFNASGCTTSGSTFFP